MTSFPDLCQCKTSWSWYQSCISFDTLFFQGVNRFIRKKKQKQRLVAPCLQKVKVTYRFLCAYVNKIADRVCSKLKQCAAWCISYLSACFSTDTVLFVFCIVCALVNVCASKSLINIFTFCKQGVFSVFLWHGEPTLNILLGHILLITQQPL